MKAPATETVKWAEATMLLLLRERYDAQQGWAIVEHVGDSTGFDKARTADAVVMHTWPSRGYETLGFEVKVSRSDWQRELKKPAKAESIARFCHRWYLVVPDAAIVKEGELPLGWGLLVVKSRKSGDQLEYSLAIAQEAELREPAAKDDGFIASLLRSCLKRAPGQQELVEARKAGSREGFEAGKGQGEHQLANERRSHEALKEVVAKFESESGVTISRWGYGNVGQAVRMLTEGGLDAVNTRLTGVLKAARLLVEGTEQQLAVIARAKAAEAPPAPAYLAGPLDGLDVAMATALGIPPERAAEMKRDMSEA